MSKGDRYDVTYIKDVKYGDGMSPVCYEDVKRAFAYVDLDKSNSIEISELKKELNACKEQAHDMFPDLDVDEVIDLLVKKCDFNKDGKITFKEMVSALSSEKIDDITSKDNTDKIFMEFSSDGDTLTINDLRQAAKELREDPADVEKMMEFATDGNGKSIDRDTFYEVLNMTPAECKERANHLRDLHAGKETSGSRKPNKKR